MTDAAVFANTCKIKISCCRDSAQQSGLILGCIMFVKLLSPSANMTVTMKISLLFTRF